ncbi:MAG: glycine cleavage system aminomethyltransferase GcvT [Chloroflexi bacterium]|nr:glycine cleavage system aminomethyltransferase GcvT [Chloroflexota bacterium]
MTDAPLKQTPLAAVHRAMGARMVEFGGWDMPVQYRGIIEEHRAVRTAAGLFDLGHMGQVEVTGPDAAAFLNWVATNDVATLAEGHAQYALLCRDNGGVIDDILIYALHSWFLVVVNASNTDKDVRWLLARRAERTGLNVAVRDISAATMMLALQGPRAATILQPLTDLALDPLPAFGCAEGTVDGVAAIVARTGYTGEDGFELYFPPEHAERLWTALLAAGEPHGLLPIGLGARDTLRLEAKMALYGHELTETINPYEARLGWAVKLDKGDFIGRTALTAIDAAGPARKLVGFKMVGRGVPRADYPLVHDGEAVGHVTSGTMSPTLGEAIGLGLVRSDLAGVGRPLHILIRERPVEAVQVPTPFYRRPKRDA